MTFDPTTRYETRDKYQQLCEQRLSHLHQEMRPLVEAWLKIGLRNDWIAEAYDPPFDVLSFTICKDVQELADKILMGNWCLGQAFVLDNICFINQINGGDEWLTIKGKTSFESITMKTFDESQEDAEKRLKSTIARIQNATEEQCRNLDY